MELRISYANQITTESHISNHFHNNPTVPGCLLFNGPEKMNFLDAATYCKEAYNGSALGEVPTEAVSVTVSEDAKVNILCFVFSNLSTYGVF